jgi:hypothetical protein
MNSARKRLANIAPYAMLLALSLPAQSDTIKNTTIPMGEITPEAFVALGGFYKALDMLEKEKSYGDKISDILKEIRTATYLDAEKQHPYIELADKSLGLLHKNILESSKVIPKEDVIGMIKKIIDDRYGLFNAAKKEGKIRDTRI